MTTPLQQDWPWPREGLMRRIGCGVLFQERLKAPSGPIGFAPPRGAVQIALLQDLLQLGTRAGDAALHRADAAIADFRRFFIAEAAGTNQDQHFALIGIQLPERAAEIVELQIGFLRRSRSMAHRPPFRRSVSI